MPPLSLMIKPVSGRCNLRCRYCFYQDEMSARAQPLRDVMSLSTLETLLRRAFAYADDFLSFTFQGGEPTLAGEDFFRAFLSLEARYNTRGLRVFHSLQTNGVDLSPSLCRLLAQGRFLVGVSVDGTEALHDECRRDASNRPTYARALEGARRLLSLGAQVNLLTVVDARAAQAPEAVFSALAPFRFLQFIPRLEPLDGPPLQNALTGEAWGRFLCSVFRPYQAAYRRGEPVSVREFDNYIAALLGYPAESCALQGHCSLGYVVEGDGSVYPCDFYALDEWKLGSVLSDSFFRLSKSPAALRFLARSPAALRKECASCPGASLCRGGCFRERDGLSEETPGPVCAGRRLFFETHMRNLEDMAREESRRRKR